MPKENENVFIAESQSLNVDEQQKKDILSVIESCNDLQDFIKRLEEENLIWYFIGPLLQDKDIKEQISSKWKTDFQKFEQSINETHKKFEAFLPSQSFLAYLTKDNDFNIRFENKEESIKISNILRASNESKVYNISLGKGSQMTAYKKNGNERHYDFAGPGSCEMTINWQAKDSEGNSIDCSMTVKLDSGGIQSVIGEPKFGDLKLTPEETKDKILKLVEQNKEVFINGKTLYQAMGQSVDNTQDPSSQLPTLSSSAPSSRRSPVSTSSEFSGVDEIFESGIFDDEEEHEQEGEELENRVKESEEENTQLRKDKAGLQKLNQEITEEGDGYRLALDILEERVKKLEAELERKVKELARKDQEIEQLKQKISVLEQGQEDKNAKIAELNNQLKDKGDEVQSINGINEELQKELYKGETELSRLRAENTELRNDIKRIVEGLKDDHEKQLAEQLLEIQKKLTDATSQLDKERLKNKELAEELNQLQKEKEALEMANQQPNIGEGSLADEMSEGNARKDEETKKLDEEVKQKDLEIGRLKEDLKRSQEENEQLKQKTAQNAGVDASSSTDQRETREVEVQTDVQMNDFRNLFDEKGEYVRTELSAPKSIHAQDPEKSPPLPKG